MVTSRSIDATDDERMPYITSDGRKTFYKEEAITSEDRDELELKAKEFNLQRHEYGVDVLD